MGIDGVKAEPAPEPTPTPTPLPSLAPAEPTPPSDDKINQEDEEAAPHLPSNAPAPTDANVATTAALVSEPTNTAAALNSPLDDESGGGECNLLGDFALLVQGALGLLAVSSLAVKRWRESPRRPLKIWFFDVSKQVFGSVLLHLANVLMSMLSSGKFDVATKTNATPHYAGTDEKGDQPNPCSFYLLNLAIDVRSLPDDSNIPMLTHTDHDWYPDSCPSPKDSPPRLCTHTPR